MASQYRIKRGPVIGLLLLIAVVGAVLVTRSSVRPQLSVSSAVTIPDAYEGTTYAVDGLVCILASSLGVTVDDVRVGGATRLGLRPEGVPVTVAFPAAPDALEQLEGTEVAAGELLCTRLMVTANGRGEQRAEPVRLRFRYGPLGLLRRSETFTPPLVLQVTGTGTDPRTTA